MNYSKPRISQHCNLFFNALVFLTRWPAPKNARFSPRLLHLSAVYFPWVGLCIGFAGAIFFGVAQLILPPSLALLLTMAACIYFTGAFHEDGWADTCDALGGGYGAEHIKRIMKDSRLGTYGVVGLIGLLAIRYTALYSFTDSPWVFGCIFIFGNTFSRWLALTVMWQLPYVQDADLSKSKPLATGISMRSISLSFIAVVFSGFILAFGTLGYFIGNSLFLLPVMFFAVLARFYICRLLMRSIGGFTGDGLGAVQQLSEVVFYIALTVLLH